MPRIWGSSCALACSGGQCATGRSFGGGWCVTGRVFRKLRPKRSESRKPRAITREGCKPMMAVKKEKTGNWVVTRFVKEHNHPLVLATINCSRNVVVSQTQDEKDVKILELTAELQRERK